MEPKDERSGTVFAIDTQTQHVRLMELPPALLEEVTTNDSTLELKTLTGDVSSNVVLCTPSQTFSIRQNQSSNTLFLTETAVSGIGNSSSGEAYIKAVAQPKGMLEIMPTTPDAPAYLKRKLPVLLKDHLDPYSKRLLPEMDHMRLGIKSCIREAPFSEGEFRVAFESVCGFEHDNGAWITGPAMALEAWRGIIAETPNTSGKSEISFDLNGIIASLTEYSLPENLFTAVIRRVGSLNDDKAILNPDKAIKWIAELMLLSSGENGVSKDSFVSKWHDYLPVTWQEGAILEKIKDKYSTSPDGDVIYPIETDAFKATDKVRVANKWHEKLKASRK